MRRHPQRRDWRRWVVAGAGTLLVLHGAVYLLYTRPRLTRVHRATSLLESARARMEAAQRSLRTERDRVAGLRRNARDVRAFFEKVVGSPRTEMVPDLLAIEEAAREAGLKVDRRAYAQTTIKEAPLLRVVTKVPLSGSYPQLVEFLSALERSPRFIVIDRVTAESGRTEELDLSVEISTYYRAEPEQLTWQGSPTIAPTP